NGSHNQDRRYAEYGKLAKETTEFLWQRARLSLPSSRKNHATATNNNVTVLVDVQLPESVDKILEKGPKFSYEPSPSRHQLLAMVHRVARSAGEQDRVIGDGVNSL
ncbi:hypothetical protein HPB47_000723, partial [Ixodes persulcatus]